MIFINGISEVTNPALTVIPVIMMTLSGYTLGRIISRVLYLNSTLAINLTFGNVILNFLFISGFIFFGILTYAATQYFDIFTYILVALSVIGIYFILKQIINQRLKLRSLVSNKTNIPILFGIAIFIILILYNCILVYYHPIFWSEYDNIYLFLPISKSILLGNGLNHDYYLGSDIAIRLPPLIQAFDAWLIHSFGYSSFRIFPVYFIIFAALGVYSFARNITKDHFQGLFAAAAFLITPSLLVMSSRFSLQQDLAFLFFLGTTFYLLSNIVRQDKPAKIHIVILIILLSLMILTREIGLIISVAIFFLVPAIKFTEGNMKLRALFSVLSLLPLYMLSFYDLFINKTGFTNTNMVRLISLLIANLVLFFILSKVRNQNQFRTILSYSGYLTLFSIPLIFIAINFVMISGPYPTLILSSKFNESLALYRQIFGIHTNFDLIDSIQKNLPRIDILFISVAMGSIFIFFKLRGFARLVKDLKNSHEYAMIICLIVILLIVWSYLLNSDFESAGIRHVAYFLPLTSILLVIGMNRTPAYRLYNFALIVIATFYFILFNLYTLSYNNHFGGFWIDPNKSSIIDLNDLRIGAGLFGALIIFELAECRICSWSKKYSLQRFSTFGFISLLLLQLYILYSGAIKLAPIEALDQIPPPGWENNVFGIINYLKNAQPGNVLGIRVPSVPFFTNRTDFDIYSARTFSSIYPLLTSQNSTLFKQKISAMGIRYIIAPNENHPLYQLVRNLKNISTFMQIINTDSEFEKITLGNFDIYKYDPGSSGVNLIDKNLTWKAFDAQTKVSKNNGTLNVFVNTTKRNETFHRAYLVTQINLTERPLLLSLDYSSTSYKGKARFYAEIRDVENNNNILWSHILNNSAGKLTNQAFVLPAAIAQKMLGKLIEFRLYVISNGAGEYDLIARKARMTYT
jgi:hypothetical protein